MVCDVLTEEVRHFARTIPEVKRIEVIEQGLHNTPDLLRKRLQEAVAAVEEDLSIEAIVLVYGLCSRGIEGVTARRCPLVVAKAHDCITLLLGSKERYAEYVRDHPGTYWYSAGWNRCHIPPGKERFEALRAQYLEKYGEEDADYLMELEQDWMRAYSQATFVDLGAGASTEDAVAYTQKCADWLGWGFDTQQGDPGLLKALLSGEWDSARFVVLQPGETVRFTANEEVLAATPCTHCHCAKNG